MKYYKRILSLLTVGTIVAVMASGCGQTMVGIDMGVLQAGVDNSKQDAGEAQNQETENLVEDSTPISVKLWVTEEITDLTMKQLDSFKSEYPEYKNCDFLIEAVGEGRATEKMLEDVSVGADVYCFSQDQLARLVSAELLMPIMGEYSNVIKSENGEGSVSAATHAKKIFAFPMTADNGYFLYYDKSVVTRVNSLHGILDDCKAAGKKFCMEINSGWYQPAFFFGAGCDMEYVTSDAGNFEKSKINYASDNGMVALKAIIELHKSPAFYNGSSIADIENVGAIVDGTWDANKAKEILGENYACVKLPNFTADGKTCQMSGFGGFKLMGIKPQEDKEKERVCLDLARYLSSEKSQLERYESNGWGPSNKAAKNNEIIKADKALTALADQLQYTVPQGQYPDDYWKLCEKFGNDIIEGKYDDATDSELMKVLCDFQNKCESLVY